MVSAAGSAPPHQAVPSTPLKQPTSAGVTAPGAEPRYCVTGSKKGGFPVMLEKRGHKKVTVVRNVTGDRTALLAVLKKRLGCGGVLNDDGSIEVQGERRPAIEKLLAELKCLKSVSKANQGAVVPAIAARVAEPTKIDKKMAGSRAPAKTVPEVELSAVTEQAAKRMKPKELKAQLKAAGLPIQGNKNELLARLLENINV